MESAIKTIKGVSQSDVFGTRLERCGVVRAAEDMWMQLASIASPSFAELVARIFGDGATFVAAGAAAGTSEIDGR